MQIASSIFEFWNVWHHHSAPFFTLYNLMWFGKNSKFWSNVTTGSISVDGSSDEEDWWRILTKIAVFVDDGLLLCSMLVLWVDALVQNACEDYTTTTTTTKSLVWKYYQIEIQIAPPISNRLIIWHLHSASFCNIYNLAYLEFWDKKCSVAKFV